MEDEDDFVVAYTDGSYSRHDQSGGWAFRARMGVRTLTRYGYSQGESTNVMELTAILNVLEFVTFTPRKIVIYTDSKYCYNTLRTWWRKWKRQGWTTATGAPVANLALVMRAAELIEQHSEWREINFKWVKGHSGNPENDYVDKLASVARKQRLTNWTGGNH